MRKPDEEAIFNAARKLSTPESRRQYLAQACGKDRELRSRVEALLRVHDEARSFLESPALEPYATAPMIERPGTVIGPCTPMEQA